MIRRLSTTVSAFSLLACVTAAIAWARSERQGWQGEWRVSATDRWMIRSADGDVGVRWERSLTGHSDASLILRSGNRTATLLVSAVPYPRAPSPAWSHERVAAKQWETAHRLLGLKWDDSVSVDAFQGNALGMMDWYGEQGKSLVLPDWLIVAALLVPPLVWLIRDYRDRQRRETHCAKCGYDLRASAGRCPECGLPIKQR